MRLEAKRVSFHYPKHLWLIRDLSICIKEGEIVGLIGQSGCGKSTLARIMAGYENPMEGIVLFAGKPLPKKGFSPVQLIFQHPEKSVNPRWRMGLTLKEGQKYDMQKLDDYGISKDWLSRWPNELSAGELQRFCVSRALGPDTRFLIADEMTTMLDSITQAQIYKMVIEKAKQQKTGILAISHNIDLLKKFCERIIDFNEINHLCSL
jgi:peptide/nickel transport system ATP-binding protein